MAFYLGNNYNYNYNQLLFIIKLKADRNIYLCEGHTRFSFALI